MQLVGFVTDAVQHEIDTPPALRDYESRLNGFATQLQERIRQTNAQPVNVSRLFYLYSFDVMSDLAFGEPLDMLINDKNHFAVGFLQDGMDLLGPLSPVPWLVRIGLSIPGVAQNFKTLLSWSAQKLEHRIQDPSHLSKLRAEIKDALFPYDSGALKQMSHLNGVINEALRLHPALPSGGLRQTPEEGLTIAGHFIPGGVTISAPRYSLGRLDSCYECPNDFVPERWYSKPEMTRNGAAFSPFSTGTM
ncbi:MAG: hypothetical protein Q9222_001700 [Ikaeria aurantiellina]